MVRFPGAVAARRGCRPLSPTPTVATGAPVCAVQRWGARTPRMRALRGCSAWRKPDEPREPASSLSGPTSIEFVGAAARLGRIKNGFGLVERHGTRSLGPA
jgi:hypothetical protein